MVFRSKIDRFFVNVLIGLIFIIGISLFFPLAFDEVRSDFTTIFVLMSLFFLLTGFVVWTLFSVKYVFTTEHLLVKGGPFRSRIPYENIRKVSSTTAVFTGYRVLSSKDALEVFYDFSILGSVKISPENKESFLIELKNRCPNL